LRRPAAARLILSAAILLVLSENAIPANWVFSSFNILGNRCYFDADSIKKTPEGTILVWRRTVVGDQSIPEEKQTSVKELREVDCSRMKYRNLQWISQNMKTNINPNKMSKDWFYFEPDGEDPAFYKGVCGTGKK
jgi:hypothetical protein